VSELLCLLGGFLVYPVWTIIGATGVVLGAAYLLWTLQRMFFGEVNEKYRSLADLKPREIVSLVPLAVIVLVLGIQPMLMLDTFQPAAERLARLVGAFAHPALAVVP
jgi:NADH-quinone oxidoreductase subunit M